MTNAVIEATLDGRAFEATAVWEDDATLHLFCGGADAGTDASPFDRLSYKLNLGDVQDMGTGAGSGGEGSLVAPMPGKVIKVLAAEGDSVSEGDQVVLMEAMKMEHALKAPYDGTVTEVNVSDDSIVDADQVLATIEPLE